MSKAAKYILALWIGVLAVGAGWIGWEIVVAEPGQSPGSAGIGGPFQLTDHNGQRVSEADFQGRLTIYYFGFTFCPDACPTALVLVQTALERLGPAAADKIRVVLVSVDPERDTPAVLKEYVEQFGPQFVGLTGSAAEIAAAAAKFRVFYSKVPGKAGAPYLIDHSSVLFLMDRRGRYLQGFTHSSRAADIARALERHL